MSNVTVKQEGPLVLMRCRAGGRELVLELPWSAALDVAAALREKAKQAEEIANSEGLVFDQALLLRTGAPLGLTNHPDIQREAAKEAEHNSTLRRYLPGGVRSQEQLGVPAVIQKEPGS